VRKLMLGGRALNMFERAPHLQKDEHLEQADATSPTVDPPKRNVASGITA